MAIRDREALDVAGLPVDGRGALRAGLVAVGDVHLVDLVDDLRPVVAIARQVLEHVTPDVIRARQGEDVDLGTLGVSWNDVAFGVDVDALPIGEQRNLDGVGALPVVVGVVVPPLVDGDADELGLVGVGDGVAVLCGAALRGVAIDSGFLDGVGNLLARGVLGQAGPRDDVRVLVVLVNRDGRRGIGDGSAVGLERQVARKLVCGGADAVLVVGVVPRLGDGHARLLGGVLVGDGKAIRH